MPPHWRNNLLIFLPNQLIESCVLFNKKEFIWIHSLSLLVHHKTFKGKFNNGNMKFPATEQEKIKLCFVPFHENDFPGAFFFLLQLCFLIIDLNSNSMNCNTVLQKKITSLYFTIEAKKKKKNQNIKYCVMLVGDSGT
jgi:hypothetical protein